MGVVSHARDITTFHTWSGSVRRPVQQRYSTHNTVHGGKWHCVEAHVKLNDSGQSNGIQEFWIDGLLEARRDKLNFVTSYTGYAINAVFIERYWNAGSPKLQERYVDNIVVSTRPIGCTDAVVSPPRNYELFHKPHNGCTSANVSGSKPNT